MKWMRGYGTRFVWNSVMSTLRAPSKRSDAVGDEAVQVGVRRALDVEVAAAHVVESLVVHAEGHVSVLEEGVGREHGVVRLDNRVGNLRCRGDGERELGLAAVVDR